MKGVYLLNAKGLPLFKIGMSQDIKKRIASISTSSPCEIDVIHAIESEFPRDLEAYFHDLFSGKRTHGEWFNLAPYDIEIFKSFDTTKKECISRIQGGYEATETANTKPYEKKYLIKKINSITRSSLPAIGCILISAGSGMIVFGLTPKIVLAIGAASTVAGINLIPFTPIFRTFLNTSSLTHKVIDYFIHKNTQDTSISKSELDNARIKLQTEVEKMRITLEEQRLEHSKVKFQHYAENKPDPLISNKEPQHMRREDAENNAHPSDALHIDDSSENAKLHMLSWFKRVYDTKAFSERGVITHYKIKGEKACPWGKRGNLEGAEKDMIREFLNKSADDSRWIVKTEGNGQRLNTQVFPTYQSVLSHVELRWNH